MALTTLAIAGVSAMGTGCDVSSFARFQAVLIMSASSEGVGNALRVLTRQRYIAVARRITSFETSS